MSNDRYTLLFTHSKYTHCDMIEIVFLKHDFAILTKIVF